RWAAPQTQDVRDTFHTLSNKSSSPSMSLEISPNEIGFTFKTLNGKKFARKKVLQAFSKSAPEFYLAPTPPLFFSSHADYTNTFTQILQAGFPKCPPHKNPDLGSTNRLQQPSESVLWATPVCYDTLSIQSAPERRTVSRS